MTGREKLFIGGGIAVAGVLALFRDSVGSGIVQLSEKAMAALNFMQTEPGVQAFAAVLPERSKPYARAIVEAASYRGFSPFVVWAIMDHESRSGTAPGYVPSGPAGTGDTIMRWKTETQLGASYSFARRMNLLTGRVRKAGEKRPDGSIVKADEFEVKPPMAGGATRAGWGYGLMQIDYASFFDFIDSGKWKDPTENIKQGVEVLNQKRAFFQQRSTAPGDPRPLTGDALIRAAMAAYNTGEGNVLASLKAKQDIDRTTFTKDYSRKRWAEAAAVASAFETKTKTA